MHSIGGGIARSLRPAMQTAKALPEQQHGVVGTTMHALNRIDAPAARQAGAASDAGAGALTIRPMQQKPAPAPQPTMQALPEQQHVGVQLTTPSSGTGVFGNLPLRADVRDTPLPEQAVKLLERAGIHISTRP